MGSTVVYGSKRLSVGIQAVSNFFQIQTKILSYRCPAEHILPASPVEIHQVGYWPNGVSNRPQSCLKQAQKAQHHVKGMPNAVSVKYAFDYLCS